VGIRNVRWLLAPVGLLFLAGAASAQVGSLGAELNARRVVVSATGVESFAPLEGVAAGGVVEYRATYTNHGAAPLKGARGTVPLPDWAEYIGGSAVPAKITASLDGVSFAAPPLKRAPSTPAARTAAADVPPREYRFLRWPLGDLAPGASVTVVFRVRVTRAPGAR
jgi:hypothetical protein